MMELLVAAALKGSLLLAAAWIATAMLRRLRSTAADPGA